jgi:hypothetical protein
MVNNYIYTMVYKPTYNWGAPHCVNCPIQFWDKKTEGNKWKISGT